MLKKESNHGSSKKAIVSILILGAAILLAWCRVIYQSDHLPYFNDETVDNSLAALNFFKTGIYTSYFYPEPFDVRISSGIYVTWISGLIWALKGNLFVQRILLGTWLWLQTSLLLYLFLRKFFSEKKVIVAISSLVWLISLHLPYWYGFLQNLGELPGALCLGWCLYFIRRRPFLSFLFCGIAVWSCKFIFLPTALAWIFAYLLSLEGSFQEKLEDGVLIVLAFFAPLLLWLSFIAIRSGAEPALNWTSKLFSFALWGGHSGFEQKTAIGLFERLGKLEWKQYDIATKLKILLLLFNPSFLLPFLCRYTKNHIAFASKLERRISLATALTVLAYAAWWFLKHPNMYARHIQPALYIGFGFLGYWIIKLAHFSNLITKNYARFTLIAGCVFILVLESYSVIRSLPLFQPGTSYSRGCSGNLVGKTCFPG